MFRRSKTRTRTTQNPLRNAIEQELCPQPQAQTPPKQEEHRREKKTLRNNDAPIRSTRPLVKKPPQEKPPSTPINKSPNKMDKVAQNYESYIIKAKEALTRGDIILSEQYYQQADHYSRMMKGKV